MKRFWLVVLMVLVQPWLCATAEPILDDPTRQLSHNVIQNIYTQVMSSKSAYPELANFDEQVLHKNSLGLDKIVYEFQDPRIPSKNNLFAFTVEIKTMPEEGAPEPEVEGMSENHYDYPVLGLRLLVLWHKNPRWHRYYVPKIVEAQTDQLENHQQKYLPVQMQITADKESFKPNEKIAFTVQLKNMSAQIYDVKDLDGNNISCFVNGSRWGAEPNPWDYHPPSENARLRPGDSIQRRFVGSGLERPGPAEVTCNYNVGYQGIRPEGNLKFSITP